MLLVLRYCTIGLPVLILARLWQQRLWKCSPYFSFAVFLAVGLVRDLILLKPDYETQTYARLWTATLPILLLAQVAAGISTYAAIARLYPGIGRFAVWMFGGCLAAAGLGGLALLPVEIHRIGAAEAELRMLFLAQRWIATVLAGGLLLAVLYLSRFPSPLRQVPRNIKTHTGCVAAYFASYAALYAIENSNALGGAQWAVFAQMMLVCAVYCVWAAGLSQAGQESKPWPPLDPAVGDLMDARYRAARKMMSQAAGDGRK